MFEGGGELPGLVWDSAFPDANNPQVDQCGIPVGMDVACAYGIGNEFGKRVCACGKSFHCCARSQTRSSFGLAQDQNPKEHLPRGRIEPLLLLEVV